MGEFIIYTEDKPDSLAIRQANRDAHLAWLKGEAAGIKLLTAGPWLDDSGIMRGSMLIVESDKKETVETWLADDPYRAAGLTGTAMVKAYKWVIGRP